MNAVLKTSDTEDISYYYLKIASHRNCCFKKIASVMLREKAWNPLLIS